MTGDSTAEASVSDHDTSNKADDELIRLSEEYYHNVRYVDALRCLEAVTDKSKLTKLHLRIIEMANVAKTNIEQLLLPNPTDQGWKLLKHVYRKKVDDSSDHEQLYYDSMVYYRIKHPHNIIVSRIETPIKASLLCPMLSVFNESSLYHKWMPRWDFPIKLGLSESNCIHDYGRGHQIIQVRIDTPYPFKHREVYLHPYAVDCIDDPNMNAIFVKIDSYDTGEHYELTVPPEPSQYRRAGFDASLLIRPCPKDHPSLVDSATKTQMDDEKLLLVTITSEADGRISNVPLSLINFLTRQVIAKQWETMMQISIDVKNGKRMDHANVIQEKQELYGWVEERVQVMLKNLETESERI